MKRIWEPYNYGEMENAVIYDRNGSLFSGEPHEMEKEHGKIHGFRNTETGQVILINQHGEIAATGKI